jgi:hypothetical protein
MNNGLGEVHVCNLCGYALTLVLNQNSEVRILLKSFFI